MRICQTYTCARPPCQNPATHIRTVTHIPPFNEGSGSLEETEQRSREYENEMPENLLRYALSLSRRRREREMEARGEQVGEGAGEEMVSKKAQNAGEGQAEKAGDSQAEDDHPRNNEGRTASEEPTVDKADDPNWDIDEFRDALDLTTLQRWKRDGAWEYWAYACQMAPWADLGL